MNKIIINGQENKFKKLEEIKAEENQNANNNKKFKYIYFIITYNKFKLKQFKVCLSPEYKGYNSLEKINKKSFDEENSFLSSDGYRFKIIKESLKLEKNQKEYQISVNVEIENKKYQYIIKLKDLERDFYEYNFE